MKESTFQHKTLILKIKQAQQRRLDYLSDVVEWEPGEEEISKKLCHTEESINHPVSQPFSIVILGSTFNGLNPGREKIYKVNITPLFIFLSVFLSHSSLSLKSSKWPEWQSSRLVSWHHSYAHTSPLTQSVTLRWFTPKAKRIIWAGKFHACMQRLQTTQFFNERYEWAK